MSYSLPLFIGLRYSLARKHSLLLSFVSLISMLGISLGVLILIVALAVINGSIDTLRNEALKSVPHATASGPGISADWEAMAAQASNSPGIVAVAPFIETEALLRYQGRNQFVRVRAVLPDAELRVVENSSPRFSELMQALAETENGIVLGGRLAANLGMYGAGELSLIPLDSLLRRDLDSSQGFRVLGFADFGAYGNDNLVLVRLEALQELPAGSGYSDIQLRLRVDDVYAAAGLASTAFAGLEEVRILPWNEARASLFNALNMEKVLTGFMLLMIVVIGAINIVSTLVMVVSDKHADIAILRTMGASRATVMGVFIVQGLLAGVIGTALGTLLGVLLARHITELSLGVERLINTLFSDANIYLLSHLQTNVQWTEVALVSVAALVISFLATLYPAYRASRVRPAEVLRYE